jgi:hypothetical protein
VTKTTLVNTKSTHTDKSWQKIKLIEAGVKTHKELARNKGCKKIKHVYFAHSRVKINKIGD